jgi:hypothetical protein
MEIVEASDLPKQHKWLRWAGLEAPPLEADSWVPIVRGLACSDRDAHTSSTGTRLAQLLGAAGIEAQQRSYQFDDLDSPGQTISGLIGFRGSMGGRMVLRVAVLVHNRDRERALQIAVELNQQDETERAQRAPWISDEELTREALEAGPPPDDC